jgi:CRISPR type I-D-associated protein Csc1
MVTNIVSQDCEVSLVFLTTHDYLFYASKDYGASARPIEFLGNYALMYALNRGIAEVRRLIDGNQPHYDEDLPKMRIYATLAAPPSYFAGNINSSPQIGKDRVQFRHDARFSKITWNSTGSSLLWMMPSEKINIPKTGYYDKLVPLLTFYFYTVGNPIPSVFRIGKKYSSARLEVTPLTTKEKQGRFTPTCPVNIIDLPENTEIIQGSLVTAPPTPLLLNAELEGKYIEGRDGNGTTHQFPIPKGDRFAGMIWNEG